MSMAPQAGWTGMRPPSGFAMTNGIMTSSPNGMIPRSSARQIQWTREFWTAVEPFATGEVYVNHLDAEEATRIRAAYSENYGRLVALKNKYDPTNLFRLNQNIKPTI